MLVLNYQILSLFTDWICDLFFFSVSAMPGSDKAGPSGTAKDNLSGKNFCQIHPVAVEISF